MTSQWPLVLLALPMVLTGLGVRSAWLWVSAAMIVLLIWAALGAALYLSSSGTLPWVIERLLLGGPGDRAYHDTYYVVADIGVVALQVLVPLAVGLLLLLPHHPRRDPLDVRLFWVTVALALASQLVVTIILEQGGMPRRALEVPRGILAATSASNLLGIAAYGVAGWAALRPVQTWWRSRTR